MPTRELLAPTQRAQFTELPATLDDHTLARFYTLSDQDLQLIRRHRRASTQLGFAVQLGYARFPDVENLTAEETVRSRPGQKSPASIDDFLRGPVPVDDAIFFFQNGCERRLRIILRLGLNASGFYACQRFH